MTSINEQIDAWYTAVVSESTSDHQVSIADAMVAFGREHQAVPDIQPLNLWGFGSGMQVFRRADDGMWVDLISIAEATGIDSTRLLGLFEEEREEFEGHSTRVLRYLDGRELLYLVSHDFVMRAFACHSPWHKEFYENTKELMSHGMEKSGMFEPREGGPEFVAVVEMSTVDGESFRLSHPVVRFDDGVPMVHAPWDDADPDELMAATSLGVVLEVRPYREAIRKFMGPRVDEDEAHRLAFRGPVLPGEGDAA